MSGIVGIEEVPQLQPAADSFAGYDSASCDKFLRLVQPPDHYDTLLVSDLTFNEWAKVMGYVRESELHAKIQNLRVEVNAAFLALDAATAELRSVHNSVGALEGIEKRLQAIGDTLNRAAKAVGTDGRNVEQPDTKSGESPAGTKGSSGSTAKS